MINYHGRTGESGKGDTTPRSYKFRALKCEVVGDSGDWRGNDKAEMRRKLRTSLAVQWLGLRTFTAEGLGSIPVLGTKIPQAKWYSRKKKKEKEAGQITNVNEGMKKREPSCTVGGECKLVQPLWRTVWRFLKKLKLER